MASVFVQPCYLVIFSFVAALLASSPVLMCVSMYMCVGMEVWVYSYGCGCCGCQPVSDYLCVCLSICVFLNVFFLSLSVCVSQSVCLSLCGVVFFLACVCVSLCLYVFVS